MYSLTHPQIQCMDTLCGMTNIPAKTEDEQLWPATSELSLQNHTLVKNVDEDVVGGFDSCDDNDDGNDDDNGADDIVAGGYQQHVPSNLNYFENADDVDVSDDPDQNNDDNDSDNDDDNDDDDVVAGGYQQHVPSNLNYFDLRLRRDVPLFFEGSRHKGNEN